MRRNTNKQKRKDQKKYFTKNDIFLGRMASILRMPNGMVNNLFRQRAVTTIRLNTLIESADNILRRLKKLGFELKKVEWIDNTYIVTNMDKSEIGRMPEYHQGLYYIQNLSSMLPPLLLAPTENDRVLDMCAAPGSKTTQLAQYMDNKGEIVANDVDTWRSGKLTEVLDLFNVTNTTVSNEDGAKFGKTDQEKFDKVLLDAPCSGEGLIYLTKSDALKFWNIKKVKGLSKVQESLIDSAFKSLKKGGVMVYSTCTLEPMENEGIVTYLLKRHKNAKVVEVPLFNSKEFASYEKSVKRGILHWDNNIYDKSVSNTYRVLPSPEMMGFYIAMIKKL